jgi:hypothetical protein
MAYFPKNPHPVDVGPEDTVEFMLMENRTSSQRLVDRFRISNNSDAQTGPPFHVDLMGEPKPPAGTSLRLAAPRMYRGGEPLKLTSKGTEISGALLWVYVPDKGRFWFSVAEKGRFRNTAVARGNRLEYEWDGAKYAIETAKPIISLPGEWVIWVRLEEGWKPEPGDYLGEPIDPAFLYMGAVGD